jgi:hypothetical protein
MISVGKMKPDRGVIRLILNRVTPPEKLEHQNPLVGAMIASVGMPIALGHK